TVKVGDACFVAIGQIVNRRYAALQYIPSGMTNIESPASDQDLASQIRRDWSGGRTGERLYASLLTDFRDRPVFDGDSLSGWSETTAKQAGGAMRLLYYFPSQGAALVAARLDGLRADAAGDGGSKIRREAANAVYTADFVRAVVWCPEP